MRPEVIEQRYNISRRIKAEEETLATASLIITSTYQEIKDQYGLYDYNQPRKMQVIPPGTDLNTFHPADKTEWDSHIFTEISQFLNDPYKPIILALSRLDQRKNIISLLEAYGQCLELQELANLVIFVGVREDLQDLPTEAQEILFKLFTTIDIYNLYGKVAYPKKLAFTELPTMYRLAALSGGVFVNPALTEPFGLTLIEAAASGLPIVATEDGGPIDIIKNCRNGYLINPLDAMDIADTTLQVLGNQENYSQLAKNGLIGVRKYYSWTSHVEQYLTSVNLLLQQHAAQERVAFTANAIRYSQGAIVTGLDQILVGDPGALREFLDLLQHHRQGIIFCVTTGRRLDSALNLLKQNKIPQPDVLITSMGTEIYYSPDLTKDTAWSHHIDYLWNRRALQRILSDFPGLVLQPKLEQSEFKISYFYDAEKAPSLEEIQGNLRQNEQTVNTFLGFGQYLDIVPARASKGYALRWFIEQFNIPLENILTVGATGMDEDLMRGNTLSVVVGSKHDSELAKLVETGPIFFSERSFAGGILDGIKHYNFFERCEEKGAGS
jgi:sucrose-phosphate synthase